MAKKICQSCAMPLYDNGEILQPDIKVTSMQRFVIHALQRQGWPKIAAWLATRGIPKLER